ncbi:hypothetical protein PG984_010441 [Apiospora sp. TS-2023a]
MAHDPTALGQKARGYPKLADFMVEHDHVMLRQFRQLAVRDLLYLQAEICELEHDLIKQRADDANASGERQYYDCDWWRLHQGETRMTGGEQWKLVLQVRAKLQEGQQKQRAVKTHCYFTIVDTAMQQYQSMVSFQRPSQQQREELHQYINSASLGGLCGFLGRDLGNHPPAVPVYDRNHLNDILFLREDSLESDFLSHLLTGPILRLFHHLWRFFKRPLPHDAETALERGEHTALWYYSDRHTRLVANLIGSGVSSLLPMLSIIALFYVETTLTRLGLVCVFTVIFSLCMFLATQCRRVEIFAATAA